LNTFGEGARPVEINFPRSLYLIQPLFSAYELNPVASNAQASVPIPDGLDLDAWIVPPPREPVVATEKTASEKKTSKKGKEKEKDASSKKTRTSSRKKLREPDLLQDRDILEPIDTDVETPEERERVSIDFDMAAIHAQGDIICRRRQREGNN